MVSYRKVELLGPFDKLPIPNMLQAIHWAVEPWTYDIKPSTVFNCMLKNNVNMMEPIQVSGKFQYHTLDLYLHHRF